VVCPPSGRGGVGTALSTARKPEGGFQFISVGQLCAVWCAYQVACIRLVDVRVWFAAQELVARRCQLLPERQPTYTQEEFTKLVGGAGGVSASFYRLRTCGLLTWEPHAITFNYSISEQLSSALETMLAQITNHQRRVPVPRRLLRFLAQGCTRVLLATVLGHLFRCLYYRDGQCQPEGLCKASWIAEVFGVSERAIKTARRRLEAIGFLQRTETAQWLLNRYGQKMTINLHWAGLPPAEVPHSELVAEIASLPATSPHETAPPDSHQQLPTEEKNQKPAASRTAGVLSTLLAQAREAIREGTAPLTKPEPILRCHVATLQQERLVAAKKEATPVPPPTLRHILLQDLQDTGRLLDLYAQAIQTELIGSSEAERLTFVGLAQHVLAYRPENAGGLFRQLLTRRCFHFVTHEDEDAAQQRLKQHLYAVRGNPSLQTHNSEDWSGIW
jgi:hypothetical protein